MSTPQRSARTIHRASYAIAALLLAGCFGSAPKEEHFYFLRGPSKALEKHAGPRLGIADFSIAPGYESQRMAYRDGDYHMQYWAYRQWVSEPARMVTELAIRTLRASGKFSEVAAVERLRDPDAILEGHVVAIEEVDDLEAERWNARLAITFALRSEKSERVLLRHAFDTTRPCARRDPAEVARMISKIYADELSYLAVRIARRLGDRAKLE